jgi:hypothetical protein
MRFGSMVATADHHCSRQPISFVNSDTCILPTPSRLKLPFGTDCTFDAKLATAYHLCCISVVFFIIIRSGDFWVLGLVPHPSSYTFTSTRTAQATSCSAEQGMHIVKAIGVKFDPVP